MLKRDEYFSIQKESSDIFITFALAYKDRIVINLLCIEESS